VAHVLAATSYAPVLRGLASELAKGDQCVRVDLVEADGRSAPTVARDMDADVWIADDTAWKHLAPPGLLPPDGVHGMGTVLATSPIYMVTDNTTASTLGLEGATWLGLARLLQSRRSDIRLVVKDPAGSGDGMVGAAAVAEGVWVAHGMDASAVVLETIVPKVRTARTGLALPQRTGDVGAVAEYALLPVLNADQQKYAVLPGGDFVAELRYTFFPSAKAVADPARAAVVDRLRTVLTGQAAPRALADAGLRTHRQQQPAAFRAEPRARLSAPRWTSCPAPHRPRLRELVPQRTALEHHHGRRRVLVDVGPGPRLLRPDHRPGSARQSDRGRHAAGRLARRTLGLRVAPVRFTRLQSRAPCRPPEGAAPARVRGRGAQARAGAHGTGLYDTILAAYTSARSTWTPGQSNQVMVFTDGINDDDPGSITLAQLTQALKKAQDPRRPVQLSVVGFGEQAQLGALNKALEPIGGYVESLKTADQVQAMFIHLATGGLHTAAKQ
jgi:hypothetical protein